MLRTARAVPECGTTSAGRVQAAGKEFEVTEDLEISSASDAVKFKSNTCKVVACANHPTDMCETDSMYKYDSKTGLGALIENYPYKPRNARRREALDKPSVQAWLKHRLLGHDLPEDVKEKVNTLKICPKNDPVTNAFRNRMHKMGIYIGNYEMPCCKERKTSAAGEEPAVGAKRKRQLGERGQECIKNVKGEWWLWVREDARHFIDKAFPHGIRAPEKYAEHIEDKFFGGDSHKSVAEPLENHLDEFSSVPMAQSIGTDEKDHQDEDHRGNSPEANWDDGCDVTNDPDDDEKLILSFFA